jgi:hypothetical protein
LQWAKDDVLWDGVNGRGIKNLFETKNIDGALIEGNIFENNWADGQVGMAVIVKSGTGNGGTAAGCGSENVTIRHNIVRNSVRCWNFAALSDETDAIPAKKCTVYNNLAYNIGNFAGQNAATVAWLITQSFDDLYIDHNTTILNNDASTMQLAYTSSSPALRFVFKNNITEFAYVWSEGILGTAGIQSWAAPGYVWEENVIVMDPANWAIHPQGTNQFDDVRGDIGFTDLSGGDLSLAVSSPYKGDAEGGTDPGADISKVNLATAGVLS